MIGMGRPEAGVDLVAVPVAAVVDTNCDPIGINYVVPGNDDAARAIALYCDLAARAVIDGMATQLDAAGFDLGELEDLPVEDLDAATTEGASAQ